MLLKMRTVPHSASPDRTTLELGDVRIRTTLTRACTDALTITKRNPTATKRISGTDPSCGRRTLSLSLSLSLSGYCIHRLCRGGTQSWGVCKLRRGVRGQLVLADATKHPAMRQEHPPCYTSDLVTSTAQMEFIHHLTLEIYSSSRRPPGGEVGFIHETR